MYFLLLSFIYQCSFVQNWLKNLLKRHIISELLKCCVRYRACKSQKVINPSLVSVTYTEGLVDIITTRNERFLVHYFKPSESFISIKWSKNIVKAQHSTMCAIIISSWLDVVSDSLGNLLVYITYISNLLFTYSQIYW